ncbi:YIP1 family protein [Candidatus Woesearchaeota archaeon]|nr:YIP1 family protein [Candidatus Woesearchaeota archaeon]
MKLIEPFKILAFDIKTIKKVSKEKNAWHFGIIIIAIAGLLGNIPSFFGTQRQALHSLGLAPLVKPSAFSFFGSAIGSIVGALIWTGILYLLARLLRGKGSFLELFQPLAYARVISWLAVLNIIPLFGALITFLTGIWMIILTVIVLKNTMVLTTGRAIAVIAIPLVLIAILATVTAIILLAVGLT